MRPVVPDNEPSSRTDLQWLIIGLSVVGLGFLALFLIVPALFDEINAEDVGPPAIRVDPPANDHFTVVFAADAELEEAELPGAVVGDADVIAGSEQLLIGADSRFHFYDVFRWKIREQRDQPATSCVGVWNGADGTSWCGPGIDEPTFVGHDDRFANDEGTALYFLTNAPERARWLIVETDRGQRIVANVEQRTSLAEWDRSLGSATTAALLDADEREIWTSAAP